MKKPKFQEQADELWRDLCASGIMVYDGDGDEAVEMIREYLVEAYKKGRNEPF